LRRGGDGVAFSGAWRVQRREPAHVVPHGPAGQLLHGPGVVRQLTVFRAQHAESLDLRKIETVSQSRS